MGFVLNRWILLAALIGATILNWQFRFLGVEHALNTDLPQAASWSETHRFESNQTTLFSEAGEDAIRVGRAKKNAQRPAFKIFLPELRGIRYAEFSCQFRGHPAPEGTPLPRGRIYLHHQLTKASWIQPSDFHLFYEEMPPNWTEINRVCVFPDGVKSAAVTFEMLDYNGFLELTDVKFIALENRSWFPFTSMILLALWAWWLIALIQKLTHSGLLRASFSGILLLAISWVIVFPQTHTFLSSFGGEFSFHQSNDLFSKSEVTLQLHDPSPPPDKPGSTELKIPKIPKKVNDQSFHDHFRQLAHKRSWLHLLAFGGLSFLIFIILDHHHALRILITLAVLAETIPPYLHYGFELSDLLDFSLNVLGIILGLLIWKLLRPRILKPMAASTDS